MDNIITSKRIDWSTLTAGFSIPAAMQPAFFERLGVQLGVGQSAPIKVFIGKKSFDLVVSNSGFDRNKFSFHKTAIVRFLYRENSSFAKALQTLFSAEFRYMSIVKPTLKPKQQVKLPDELKSSIVLSATSMKGVFTMDRIDALDKKDSIFTNLTEEMFESDTDLLLDPKADIITKQRLVKIRKIDRSIGDNLKKLYDYTCQMTGEKVGSEQDANVVEAHHLKYFVKSKNNDSSNIIILSPNYHRIVHKTNARWLSKEKAFEFPNGLKEVVKVNKHL